MPAMGDSLAMNRNIANLQARIKRIEEALLALNVAGNSPQASNFPTRSSIDLGEVRIGDEMKQASSMLASLYTSETGQLTQFGVGTWPEDKYVSGAVTIHGAIQDATGQPLEIMRATLIPALLHAGIPFSNVNVDHDQQLPVDKTREIVGACASHLVMLTPGLLNYREAIISAYIAGRGNANLHIVSFGVNPLTVPVGDATRNVVGGYTPHTSRDRAVDADNILNSFLGTDVKKYNRLFTDEDDSFGKTTVMRDPDSLKKLRQVDVATRRMRWNEFVKNGDPATDIGMIIAASYLGGMLSPRQSSRFTRVQPESLEMSAKWIGYSKMYTQLAEMLPPEPHTEPENDIRDALQFFAKVIGPSFE